MGTLYLIILILLVFKPYIIYLLIVGFIYIKFIKSAVKSVIKRRLIVTGLLLFFFIEPIITNLIAGFYVLTTPKADNIVVDYPVSVYVDSQSDEKEIINSIRSLSTFLDGIYITQLAVNVKDKVYLFSCNYDSSKGYDEFIKSCIDSKRVYTKKTMPQMDYIVRYVSKSAFFARSSAYEIIDKNGRLLYIDTAIIRNRNYLLSLDTEWFAHDSDVIYRTSSGTSLNRIRVRSYMNEERLKQPKIKEFTNLN